MARENSTMFFAIARVTTSRSYATQEGRAHYKAYVRSRHCVTTQRQAFVAKLIKDELEPLVAGFLAEHQTRSQAIEAARKAAPAMERVEAQLVVAAQRGASVRELEAGSADRRRRISVLAAAAQKHVGRLASAEFEPE